MHFHLLVAGDPSQARDAAFARDVDATLIKATRGGTRVLLRANKKYADKLLKWIDEPVCRPWPPGTLLSYSETEKTCR